MNKGLPKAPDITSTLVFEISFNSLAVIFPAPGSFLSTINFSLRCFLVQYKVVIVITRIFKSRSPICKMTFPILQCPGAELLRVTAFERELTSSLNRIEEI